MKKTMNTLVCLLVVCLVLALTLNVLFITGVVHGAVGPKGETGATGSNGTNGTNGKDGKSAYELWLEQGNTGSLEDYLESLKGDSGENGRTPQWFSGSSLTEAEGAVDGDFFWLNYTNSQFVTGFSVYRMVDGTWTLFADMSSKKSQSEITPSPEDGYHIGTVEELKAFRDSVNDGKSFKGQTVTLDANIDLSNEDKWTPIGTSNKPFSGNFDGGNHTISNLTIIDKTLDYVGLFGKTTDGQLKNFTLKNVNLSGNRYVAAVVANGFTTNLIKNIKVENAKISGSHWVAGIVGSIYGNIEDCEVKHFEMECWVGDSSNEETGDKTGGIVGQLQESSGYHVTGCTVEDGTITAYRDVGGIVGAATHDKPYQVTGNTLKGVSLIIDRSVTYEGGTQAKNVDYFTGRKTSNSGADFVTGNTKEDCTIVNGD